MTMKKVLPIKPFKDFYMNCWLNNYFSYLTYLESSYKIASYTNSYSYTIKDFKYNPLKFITVDYSKSYKDLFEKEYITQEFYSFRDENNFNKELKEIILSGKPLYLYIDLFNWIPNSLVWQKYHWNHFSFIVGFDDEKRIFYAIDDDANGNIDIRYIPESRLIDSFFGTGYFIDYGGHHTKPNIDSPCIIVNQSEHLEPYKIKVEQIVFNAKKIIDDLSKIDQIGCWEFIFNSDLDKVADVGIVQLNTIYNRHIGNMFLLNELYKARFISDNSYKDLHATLHSLISNWKMAKNILIKAKSLKSLLSVGTSLISIYDMNFEQEHDYWNNMLKVL